MKVLKKIIGFIAVLFKTLDTLRNHTDIYVLDSYSGLEYDYDWITEDTSAVFCSELLYHSLKAISFYGIL
ncbi:MAG: hypothetical protein M0P40_01925 [Bacteroidales bacterium]|jgi:hypothetical protein|nr:hypothetical protein [Bacteroidales bacterium]MDD2264829.1 hypothetical protein [Bacteroidales bacterium]MDD2832073.1 hypothetical protein [Bacteroidales bacterium]MDD3208733.1 hypothetical protein [Bacteroidales bacterium]MDD3697296.1 hypothetical protein [Bacteroidales bacterium]